MQSTVIANQLAGTARYVRKYIERREGIDPVIALEVVAEDLEKLVQRIRDEDAQVKEPLSGIAFAIGEICRPVGR